MVAPAATHDPRTLAVWAALDEIADPEIPAISLVDLGVIGAVGFDERTAGGERLDRRAAADLRGLPGHRRHAASRSGSGCGAMELADEVEVRLSFAPPWTSDRITPEGREKLRLSGFAPPVLIGPILRRRRAAGAARAGDLPVLRIAQHDPGQPVRADAVPRHLPLRRLPPALRAVQSHLVGFPIMAIDADEVRSDAQELLDAGAHDRLDTMRHSAAHIMAAAVLELFPEAKLGIGPAIRDGFYYDFDLPRAADAGRPRGDRGADARPGDRQPAVRAQRAAIGPTALNQLENEGQAYKVEIVRELPDGERRQLLPARRLQRPVPRAAPGGHRRAGRRSSC